MACQKALAADLSWGAAAGSIAHSHAASVLIPWQEKWRSLRRGVLCTERWARCHQRRSLPNRKGDLPGEPGALPGPAEFTAYRRTLPVLIQPIGAAAAVLRGWSPRCFSKADETGLRAGRRKIRTHYGGPGAGKSPLPARIPLRKTLLPAEPEAGISPRPPGA